MSKILVFAPHPDDEILGCGGTLLENIRYGNDVYVCIVTKGVAPLFSEEHTRKNQDDALRCHRFMGVKDTFFLDFPSTKLEMVDRAELNDRILRVVRQILPDEVYIPHYGDMQLDHRIVAEACMVAVRPKYSPQTARIYGYETMSETGWSAPNVQNAFIPNVYVDISNSLKGKKEAMSFYSMQVGDFPDARSVDAIEALARYRGAQMHMIAAEAFMLIRELKQIQ